MTILPFPEQPAPEHTPDPNRPPAGKAFLARMGTLPSRVEVKRRARWCVAEGGPQLLVVLLKAPYLALRETPYAWIGLCRAAAGWAAWVSVAEMATPKGVEPTVALIKERAHRRMGRRRTTFILLVLFAIASWWLTVRYPGYLALAGLVLVCLFDAIGHRQRPSGTAAPAPHRSVWKEGVSSGRVVAQLVEIATREGLAIGVEGALKYDQLRRESRVTITCLDAITAEHCRAFERGLGLPDFAMRVLAPQDEEATVRILVITEGDPLSLDELPGPPPVEHSVQSIEDGVTVGVGVVAPLVLPMAGQHGAYMMQSGGGKSTWAIRNTMIGLLRCRDVRPIIIDVTDGPERALWHRVLYRSATEPEQIKTLLDEILGEIRRRARILSDIAEDDDPTNDHIIEWCRELGDYWVVIIDEYSALIRYPELVAKVEQLFRTGRKHGIAVQVFYQKSGNDDTGSSVPTSQANILVAGPCTPRDAAGMFGAAKRDRGWMPHLLKAGTQDNPHDAGKVYVDTPMHHTPDIYRYYLPIQPGEVKVLCRRMVVEGFRDGWDEPATEEDAVVVDPLLAEVARAFGNAERIPTTELLAHLAAADPGEWGELTSIRLADLMRPVRPRGLTMPDGRQLRGYERSEVLAAIQRTES